jgi:hypothetical protein
MSQKELLISATDTLCHGVRTLYPGARPAATKHTHMHTKPLGTQTKTWNLKCKTGQKRGDEKIPKTKNARGRPHTHTHKTQKKITKPQNHKETQKPTTYKQPNKELPINTNSNVSSPTKKKLIIERGCQERKEKKPPQPPEKKRKEKKKKVGNR